MWLPPDWSAPSSWTHVLFMVPGTNSQLEADGTWGGVRHCSVQEAEQPRSDENLYFSSFLDGSKG